MKIFGFTKSIMKLALSIFMVIRVLLCFKIGQNIIRKLVIFMEGKGVRYIRRIFSLDREIGQISICTWDNDFDDFLEEENKHYGLKLISDKEEILVVMEYSNIIWNYKIYYGSYKKKYKLLNYDDERWIEIEKGLQEDLKVMGLDNLKDEILSNLKSKKYFEYKNKSQEQFKRYCV